jgi:hypothetical protein
VLKIRQEAVGHYSHEAYESAEEDDVEADWYPEACLEQP